MSNNFQSRTAKLEVLAVRQRLGRSDEDRIAGVHAQRVEVLHITNRDAIISNVADDLVLDLLPAPQVLVDEDLVRRRGAPLEGPHGEVPQLRIIFRKSRS